MGVATRRQILERDEWRCVYCGTLLSYGELDHVVPRSRGGNDPEYNLALSCRACNQMKFDMLVCTEPGEWQPPCAYDDGPALRVYHWKRSIRQHIFAYHGSGMRAGRVLDRYPYELRAMPRVAALLIRPNARAAR
jgi:hypothetical protein